MIKILSAIGLFVVIFIIIGISYMIGYNEGKVDGYEECGYGSKRR